MAAIGWLHEGVVADHDVDQAVGPQHRRVRAVLAHAALELEERFDFLGLAVAVGIAQAIERRARGSVAHGEHVVAQRQNALAVGHLVAEGRDRFELAVVIFVANEHQRALLARGDDVARFVEAHGHQRAGRAGRDDLFDREAGQRRKAAFVGRRRVGGDQR